MLNHNYVSYFKKKIEKLLNNWNVEKIYFGRINREKQNKKIIISF